MTVGRLSVAPPRAQRRTRIRDCQSLGGSIFLISSLDDGRLLLLPVASIIQYQERRKLCHMMTPQHESTNRYPR